MSLGDRGNRGLLLSVGLILVESCQLFTWTLIAFTLMAEVEWMGSGYCCEREHWSRRQMHSKGTGNIVKQKVREQREGCSDSQNSSEGCWGTASIFLALQSSLHKGHLSRLDEIHPKQAMCSVCCCFFFL